MSFVLSLASYHGLEDQVKKWKPKRPREVFKWTLFGVSLTILWLYVLAGPLHGALYVKHWTGDRKDNCEDYALVVATGNQTEVRSRV